MKQSLKTLAFATALGCGVSVSAQTTTTEEADADSSVLERLIESSLSSDNQNIQVIGLEGALSAKATIEQLILSDDEGVWLTLNKAELDWNRLALLRGRFTVNTLSADSIQVLRSPNSTSDPDLPSPEATPFALPELPVAVEIGTIRVGELDLDQALLGQAAKFSIDGALSLADGALDTSLTVDRLDRLGDTFGFSTKYTNETQNLSLDLSVTEGAQGLISSLMALPNAPDLALTISGDGPLADFVAQIALDTDQTRRIDGQVILQGLGEGTNDGLAFHANLGGDIDPLLAQEYRAFFGPDLQLSIDGTTAPDGQVALNELGLKTQALALDGNLKMSSGALESANLNLQITPPNGQDAVILPVSGATTTLGNAKLVLHKSLGEIWSVKGTLQHLKNDDTYVESTTLSASGTLNQDEDLALEGDINADITGLVLNDSALQQAVGDHIALRSHISTIGSDALRLDALNIQGTDYAASGSLAFSGFSDGLQLNADLTLDANDLKRFSAVSGQSLQGTSTVQAALAFTPLSGAFEIDMQAETQDLAIGQTDVDPLISGHTDLTLHAGRDESGLWIKQFILDGQQLRADVTGDLSSANGKLQISARLRDLGLILPQLPGTVTLNADLTRNGDTLSGTAAIKALQNMDASLNGFFETAGDAQFDFDVQVPSPGLVAPQLAGAPLSVSGKAKRDSGLWDAHADLSAAGGTTLDISGQFVESDGTANLSYDLAVARLEQFVDDLNGQLLAKGDADRADGIWTIASTAQGPFEVDARLGGTWNETDGTANITTDGKLRLEGVNTFIQPNLLSGAAQFQLSLIGVPSLQSLNGQINTQGAQMVLPDLAQRINDISTQVDLSNGSAQITMSAAPAAGGQLRVTGPVSLEAPYQSNLAIALREIILTDNLSYDTVIDGDLRLQGALSGNSLLAGQINIGETNFNLNTAGGAISSAPIPSIQHVGQSTSQIATRSRAGLIETASSGSSSSSSSQIAMDVEINAPSRIFARGRGLNAELGGKIIIGGSTASIEPSGQIGLIRGTFDILGRRLSLDEGRITLQGDLNPYLFFSSSTDTEQGTATLQISGNVDAPQIEVTAEPALPSEEALALLLFGDNIQDLSPLALARLASSALTLSGRGGKTQSKLREETGVDSLDLGPSNGGVGQVGLGGYIAENIYTDVNITAEGDSELTINLDLTKSLTATGVVDNAGQTGVGVYFKHDY